MKNKFTFANTSTAIQRETAIRLLRENGFSAYAEIEKETEFLFTNATRAQVFMVWGNSLLLQVSL